MTKLTNSNYDTTQQLKLTKLKNSNCDKTQIVTKLKLWQNCICDKFKFWQNSKCEEKKEKNSKCNKIQLWQDLRTQIWQNSKLKLWQNSKTQIETKLAIGQISIFEEKQDWKGIPVKTFWHLDNRWDVLWAAFCNFLRCL